MTIIKILPLSLPKSLSHSFTENFLNKTRSLSSSISKFAACSKFAFGHVLVKSKSYAIAKIRIRSWKSNKRVLLVVDTQINRLSMKQFLCHADRTFWRCFQYYVHHQWLSPFRLKQQWWENTSQQLWKGLRRGKRWNFPPIDLKCDQSKSIFQLDWIQCLFFCIYVLSWCFHIYFNPAFAPLLCKCTVIVWQAAVCCRLAKLFSCLTSVGTSLSVDGKQELSFRFLGFYLQRWTDKFWMMLVSLHYDSRNSIKFISCLRIKNLYNHKESCSHHADETEAFPW